MTAELFAEPIGLSRDPHREEAWVVDNEYRLPHPDDPSKELRAGRASELGKTISNTFTLNKYHQRMVAEGMYLIPSLRMEVAIARTLPRNEKRLELNRIAKVAAQAAGTKEPASKGIGFHKLCELYDAGKIKLEDVPDPWDLDMIAYAAILRKTGIVCVPEFTEKIIWVRELNICGKYDRLVRYLRLGPYWVVLDLKSGFDLQYGWHEIAVQEWIYGNANMQFDMDTEEWSPFPQTCTDKGLVLHIPTDHDKEPRHIATMYEVDLSHRLDLPDSITPAQLCIAVQEWRKRKVSRVIARVEVTDDGEVIDHELSWAERIELAMSEGDLDQIQSNAKEAGEWHGGLTARKNRRLAVLAS